MEEKSSFPVPLVKILKSRTLKESGKILKSRRTISKTYDSKIVCPPAPGAAQSNPLGFKLLLGSESLLRR